ncbi:hypothetical protein MLD38_011188 [Melastoma candidum]|uniref:Uncharacterized protein n=1 Tax=Melastoma candidum TaxID=119954 RepID=A0ACB9R292_9MYRT|nr:hypothetical protein MLD38_011188 [Melastoma candidum]
MVGKEESSANPLPPLGASAGRKTYWRSASWSSSRTAHGGNGELKSGNQCGDRGGEFGRGCSGLNGGHSEGNRRFPLPVPGPLTPRSQQNFKSRSCLPPLSISRRSLDEWPKAGSDDVGEWLHHSQPPTPSGNRGGERLKLDMSAILRSEGGNGVTGLVKREKIAFFDKECSKVAEHIYLGGDVVARNREILKQNGITHILNCVGFVCPEYFKGDFVYRTLWLQDSPSEDITSILYDVFDYFEDVREQKGKVFVHCCQGVSRSTSLVIAYLMWREGQSFDDAFQFVKSARGIADPNMGFACQLLQCQKRVHAFPLSPSSLLRMYRIAPHSPYDPLHLVPKMLTDPSPAALDSRGAFIVQVPSCLYVWIGMECEPIMEWDARGAICQIVRYEGVQDPIVMIKEGAETSYFWDAFENYLPLMMDNKSKDPKEVSKFSGRKICTGKPRKVDSYDVDFEILKKAVKGGVLPPFAVSENEKETLLPAKESSWSVLRWKFAPSHLKDFVSAPKLIFSRVHSDSMMVVHSPANPSAVSATSSMMSSCSPAYLSPDSISSDSSTTSRHFSESSQDSPVTTSGSSPSLSNSTGFSKLSPEQSKSLPRHISKSENFIDINFPSRQHPLSITSPSKKLSPSLVERRGGSSRTLKLQVINDSVKTLENGNGKEEDGFLKNRSAISAREPFVEASCVVDPSLPSSFTNCLELRRDLIDPERCAPTVSSRHEEAGSQCAEQVGYVVHQWPSLEEVVEFTKANLDSGNALIFVPSQGLGKHRFLYFWLGKLVACQGNKSPDGNSFRLDVLEKKWNEDGCRLSQLLGLPMDTHIKIVKEGEEPEELLAIFRSISSSAPQKGLSNAVP